MSPLSRTADQRGEQFLSMRQAIKKSGRSPAFIQRAAILGRVQVDLSPGFPPRYSAADIDALPRSGPIQ